MYKGKKFLAFALAATLTVGAVSLAACGSDFVHPSGVPSGDVSSNGGFVVSVGDNTNGYYYFVNGVEAYTTDNTYGTPVRGALMRIKKADLAKKENKAEVVIPSLMVSGDKMSGLFIYGDRIYYTTPNNVLDTAGELQSGYLDFKSAKLDGSDIQDLFRVSDNSVEYRYVKAGDAVYVLYKDGSDLISFNTATGTETTLAKGVGAAVFNKDDPCDGTVYYTMSVQRFMDTDSPDTLSYNQIYRVSAETTAAPYTYTFDEDYVQNELEGEEPYLNLGTLVLDGMGKMDEPTQFNHPKDGETSGSPFGYTYALQSYTNEGIYFTRTESTGTSSTGEGGTLYYLSAASVVDNWKTIAGNDKLTLIADSIHTSKASSSALYFTNGEGKQSYIYVDGSVIYYAVTDGEGGNTTEQPIAYEVSGATLVSVDNTSSPDYKYVWFSRTNGSGTSIERAVYNGDPVNYQNLQFGDTNNKPYKPVKVLNLAHNSDHCSFEIIDNTLFYCDADSTVNSTSYNYVYAVSLANGDGKLMDNVELQAMDDEYNAIMDADAKKGLLAKLSANDNSKLSSLIKYYFYTGKTTAYEENLKEAEDAGKSETYLYSEKEKAAFLAFTKGEGYKDAETELWTKDDYKGKRTMASFVTFIGQMQEDHIEEQDEYWRGTLQRYTVPTEEEEEGLPAWAWALIGVCIGVVVIGAVIAVVVVVRSKNKDEAPKEEKMHVDTTDDRSVDVYAPETPEEAHEAPAPEAVEEEAAAPAEEAVEEAVEAAPAEAPEAPADAPVEAPAEAPAEEAAPAEQTQAPAEAPAEKPTEEKPE